MLESRDRLATLFARCPERGKWPVREAGSGSCACSRGRESIGKREEEGGAPRQGEPEGGVPPRAGGCSRRSAQPGRLESACEACVESVAGARNPPTRTS